jgi:hypothetical protein
MHFNKKTTSEDAGEERVNFFRNQQVQKLFIDYFFDKNLAKKNLKDQSTTGKQNTNSAVGTDKTTKLTTVNSMKNS